MLWSALWCGVGRFCVVKQKTAYEMRISDWSSDVCSSDLGIKASGMPAWGRQMSDEYLWNLVAFVQRLPNLDANGYVTLVASSEGHSHGGGDGEGERKRVV